MRNKNIQMPRLDEIDMVEAMKTKTICGPLMVDKPNIFERVILRKKENVHVFGKSLGTIAEAKATAVDAGKDALIVSTTVLAVIGLQKAVKTMKRRKNLFICDEKKNK